VSDFKIPDKVREALAQEQHDLFGGGEEPPDDPDAPPGVAEPDGSKRIKWRIRKSPVQDEMWVYATYTLHERKVMKRLAQDLDDPEKREAAKNSIDTLHEMKVYLGVEIMDEEWVADHDQAVGRKVDWGTRRADTGNGGVVAPPQDPEPSSEDDDPQTSLLDEEKPPKSADGVFDPAIGKWPAGTSGRSRDAAIDVYPRSGTQRHDLLLAVSRAENGLTCDQAEMITSLPHQSASARWNELWHDYRLIKPTGRTRRTRNGSHADIFVLSDLGREKMAEAGDL
jgi:hypothetical protein